jgi:site-specific DNA-methyltransferase (adenine-specific)
VAQGEDTTNARAEDEPAAVWVDLSSLKAWDRNPRKNTENVKRVMESIRRFGFSSPIIARRADREIIAGHTRALAAEALGMKRVPVRFLDLDPGEAHLLALADNRLNELSPWDRDELQSILSQYSLEDAELAGWTGDDLEKMATDLLKDAGEDEEAEDQSEKAKTDFAVLIECADEQEQLHVIAQCEKLGLRVRSLV